MRDAIEIQNAQIEYNGKNPEELKTFCTCRGEIYIGLRFGEKWMNVPANKIHEYIKGLGTLQFYGPVLQEDAKDTSV